MSASDRLKQVVTRPTTVAVAVLTLLWAFFFWRLLTPTMPDRVLFAQGDFTLHFFTFVRYGIERLWQGEIPLWNPYNYAGDPFAANVQMAVWYPPRWISALLAGHGGWDVEALQLEVAVHYWLSSLTMAAFLRVLVKQWGPALLGSILWTYGGYLTGYPMLQPSIVEGLTWLPVLMIGAHLSITDSRWRVRGIVLGGAMIALAFLAGHMQTAMHMTYLAVAYLAVVGWQHGLRWRDLAWRIALLGVTGAALCAVQLLPALEFSGRSFRAEDFYYVEKSEGFTFTELAQIVWPRLYDAVWWPLYAGVVALLVGITALLRPRKSSTFWIGVLVVALWLSVGGHSAVYDFFYVTVPGFSMFRQQERAASLAAFALIVLVTQQLGWLLGPRDDANPDERRLVWLARGHLAVTGLAFVIVALVVQMRGDDPRNVTANALGLVAAVSLSFNGWLAWRQHDSRPAARYAIPAALFLLVIVELFTLGMKSPNFVPDTDENRIHPPAFVDILSQPVEDIHWHVDGAAGIEGHGTYARIPDMYGTGPLKLASLEKLRRLAVDVRWEIFAVRYATMFEDVPQNVALTPLGEGLNYDGQPYTLYELDDPRPFVHLVYRVRLSEEGNAGARAIMQEPYIKLREIGVTTQPLPFDLPGERPDVSTVEAFRMTMPEYMEMSVSTGANALLTLPVADYPGWQATVDGERVAIIDTYAGLIGIPIRAGEHHKVTLRFFPRTLIAGGIISGPAWIVVIGYLIGATVRRRRTRRTAAN